MGKSLKLLVGSVILAVLGSFFSFIFLLPVIGLAAVIWTICNIFIGDLSFWQALGYSFLFLFLRKIFFARPKESSSPNKNTPRGWPSKKRSKESEEFIDVSVKVKDE